MGTRRHAQARNAQNTPFPNVEEEARGDKQKIGYYDMHSYTPTL
jgi:hypothetical protein